MKVFINPGHMPGKDPGAVNQDNGLREADVVLAIGKLVEYHLKNAGCAVLRLQSDNLAGESVRYPNVCKTANDWGADIFVSLHCNAFNGYARGTETLVYNLTGEAAKLGRCIQTQLVKTLQLIDVTALDRGLKERKNLIVLKRTTMPAVLVEIAFVDNDFDMPLLRDHQDEIARAIARGITDYDNI